jgi:hypothetical protein
MTDEPYFDEDLIPHHTHRIDDWEFVGRTRVRGTIIDMKAGGSLRTLSGGWDMNHRTDRTFTSNSGRIVLFGRPKP